VIPDAEKVVGTYLRSHADIVALAARVVGKTPASTEAPWIRLTQLDARNERTEHEHLIAYFLQLDCYAGSAGGQPEASTLARTTREALHEMQFATHADVVVSSVGFTGMARVPDTDVDEPARERFVLDSIVRLHPI